MSRKTFLLFALLLCAPAIHAAGGTCPSGSLYTSLTNPTGPLVTLASLNITGCYFVAANGSDSNSGTTEAAAWLHAPQMPNCSSQCATVQNASGGIPKSSGIILRGGDTWHMGIKTDSAGNPSTGGTWNFHTGQNPQPTPANPIYIGVDPTWFSGASWVRPIITGDNPICNGSTLSATCIQNVGLVDQIYYVTSCAHQNGSGTNTFFDFSFVGSAYIVDNLELTGMCESATGQVNHNDDYFNIASLHAGPIFITNVYAHGSSHLQFGTNNGNSCAGLVCFNMTFLDGSSVTQGPYVLKTVIDFSDSDPVGTGYCKSGGMYNLAYSVVLGTSQCIGNDFHLIHDNIIGNFYENGHSNLFESNNDAEASGTNAMYNNVFAHLQDTPSPGAGGQLIDLSPPVGTTDNFFNNIMWGIGNVNPIFGWGNHSHGCGAGCTAPTNNGQYNNWNNIFQLTHSQPVYSCSDDAGGQGTYPYSEANDFFISDNSAITGNSGNGVNGCAGTTHIAPQGNCGLSSCSISSTVVTLLLTNSAATTDGYKNTQAFVFSPTLATSPTVGAGNNVQATLCAALATAAGSDSTLSDAATACQSDTRYACTYNQSVHTVSCPGRGAISRPATAALDIGAYQFAAVPGVSISPTSFNYGSVVLGTNSAQTFTITSANSVNLVMGTPPATITGTNAGDFTLQVIGSQCTNGQSLPQSSTCLEGVSFAPLAVGARSAQLNIFNNVSGSPQVIPLSGTGVTATPVFSPTFLSFGSMPLYLATANGTVSLTNTGSSSLVISSVTTAAPFVLQAPTVAPDCRTIGTVAPGGSCNISVNAVPAIAGFVSGTVSVADNAVGSPHTVPLSVTGLAVAPAPAPSFAIVPSLPGCPVCTSAMQPCLCFTMDKNIYLSSGAAYSLFATFTPVVTSVNGQTGDVKLAIPTKATSTTTTTIQ